MFRTQLEICRSTILKTVNIEKLKLENKLDKYRLKSSFK